MPTSPTPPDHSPASSRRVFLKRAGGVVVVLGAGGLGARAYEQGVLATGDGDAYDAWTTWQQGTGPMALVAAAILAANPHNSQAWTFKVTPSRIDLFADQTRATGTLDPVGRDIHVGLGCALEN